MSKIGVGVIGCGYMGRAEAQMCTELPDVQLVSVFDPLEERARALAKELRCEWEETLEQLLGRDDIDAVIVATPNYVHTQCSVSALEHGKHVFLEKPMALTQAECNEIIRASEDAKRILMVGHPMRVYPGIRKAWTWINEGKLGDVVAVDARRTGWLPGDYDSWKVQMRTSGGHLFHHIHELDLLQWLAGQITEVSCYSGNRAHKDYPDAQDDTVYGLVRFSNGAFGGFKYGSAFHVPEHEVRIYGTKGAVVIDFKNSNVQWFAQSRNLGTVPLHQTAAGNNSQMDQYATASGGAAHGTPKSIPPPYLYESIFRLVELFIGVVSSGVIPEEIEGLVGGRDGRSSVMVAEAAVRSARNQQPTRIIL